MPYRLYGIPAGLYPGKARSYLRQQAIDFIDVAPGCSHFRNHIVPAVGRWINPIMETPDGDLIQDTVDIIDHFERGPAQHLVRCTAYPTTPVHLAVSHVFEMFGGEGLLRPAMHYRWNFDDENLDFIRSEFSLCFPSSYSQEEADEAFDNASSRMRQATRSFGVNADTAPLIEAAFQEWLNLFSTHLADHPYLLGGHATLGDYGLMATMWQHLFRDPVPQFLIKRTAPRVGRWVERMSTIEPYHLEPEASEDLITDDNVPDTLLAMMRFVAEEYLPEISAHVERANQWLANHPNLEAGTNGVDDPAARGLTGSLGLGGDALTTFEWRGRKIETGVMPYRFWLMQRLQDDLAIAEPAEQEKVRNVLRSTGLEALLDLKTSRRVERVNNLEVWGPTI
ncbi:MAG: glutathione S-transferase [Gammaproteobacteria bacterium]|nr:glutathione S-transferase [Gammaproteobacteria bacterium]